MRFLLFLSLTGLLVFGACQSNQNNKTGSPADTLPAARPVSDPMQGQEEALQKQADELGQLSPVKPGVLEKKLPLTLMGGERTAISAELSNGVPMATAAYRINDSIRISLTLYDCAGSAGAGFFNTQFAALAGALTDNEKTYLRGVEMGSRRGFEQGDKITRDGTITWMEERRYLVILEGTRVGGPALRQAAGSMRL